MERLLQRDDSGNSSQSRQRRAPSIWTRGALIGRLSKGRDLRRRFVESQIANEIAFQVRALRHKQEWSQPALARELDTTQNQIYRLENPAKSKPTISTLKKIAALFDVGLVVRFVPFGEMIDYLSGTPRLHGGLSTTSHRPLNFSEELPILESSLVPERPSPNVHHERNAANANATENPLNPAEKKVISIDSMRKAMSGQTNAPSELRPPQRASGNTDGDRLAAAAAAGSRGV
jgi:transcriptional regulator with XRE-family HTH domain